MYVAVSLILGRLTFPMHDLLNIIPFPTCAALKLPSRVNFSNEDRSEPVYSFIFRVTFASDVFSVREEFS